MEKELEGIDEIKDIEIEKKPELNPCLICGKKTTGQVCSQKHQDEWIEKQKPSKKETKELIKESNNDPEAKRHKVKAMKKSTYIMLWVFASICLILFMTQVVWSNTNLSNFIETQINKTGIEVNNNITVNSPDIPITNNYENNSTVNINIDIGDEIADTIASDIIEIINNTNFTQ